MYCWTVFIWLDFFRGDSNAIQKTETNKRILYGMKVWGPLFMTALWSTSEFYYQTLIAVPQQNYCRLLTMQ